MNNMIEALSDRLCKIRPCFDVPMSQPLLFYCQCPGQSPSHIYVKDLDKLQYCTFWNYNNDAQQINIMMNSK